MPTIDQLFQAAVQKHQAGRAEEAKQLYRQVLARQPDHADALNMLGMLAAQVGRTEIALNLLRRAIAVRPEMAEAHANLGGVLHGKGMLNDAVAAYRQAIALKPDFPEAYSNLGGALDAMGQLDDAIAACRQAIALRPNFGEAHNQLGNALKTKGELDEAIAAYRQAVAITPDFAEAHTNLGNALKDVGAVNEAVAAYRQALALKPDLRDAHTNLVLSLHYHPGFDAAAIAEELGRWNRRHAEPLQKFILPHRNERTPDRRLRVGYVSGDFREHAAARFLLPLLAHHDHQHVEIFCYAQVSTPDEMTQRLRGHADHWRNLVNVSDEQAAEMIRNDQIDILVDLVGQTAQHRLLLFAQPAPVQVTYLGYVGSTGLTTIDYRLSDPYLDPPGVDESVYSERTFRLPQTYWCYEPIEAPPIGPLPALAAGHITFGCLNNFCKVTEPTLTIWGTLLQAVADSHLLLHAHEGSHRHRTLELLRRAGVDPQRVRFVAKVSTAEYLQLYQQIDIALDPFPYGGGTTTCDGLWMGVPVISLRGPTAVGRAGVSILSNVGLSELVADSHDQYVQIAATLASDRPHLAELRGTLRERMRKSPLMDASRFVRDIEAAYRRMWTQWCSVRE